MNSIIILLLLSASVASAQSATSKAAEPWVFLCAGPANDVRCPRKTPPGWEIDLNPDTGMFDECHDGECRQIPVQLPAMCENAKTHKWRKWKQTGKTERERTNEWYNECVKPFSLPSLRDLAPSHVRITPNYSAPVEKGASK